MFEISSSQYGLATAVGAGLALVLGAIWSVLALPFFSFLIPLGVGYLIGEAISRALNRKRSLGLQVIAGLSVYGAYLVSRLLPYLAAGFLTSRGQIDVATLFQLAAFIVVGTFTQPYLLLMLALGIFIGVTRVR